MTPTLAQFRLLAREFTHEQRVQMFGRNLQGNQFWVDQTAQLVSPASPLSMTPDFVAKYGIDLSGLSEELQRMIPQIQEFALSRLVLEVRVLGLSARPANHLEKSGIQFIWQVCELTEAQLKGRKGLGPKSRNEVTETISDSGVSLRLSPSGPLIIEAKRRTGHT